MKREVREAECGRNLPGQVRHGLKLLLPELRHLDRLIFSIDSLSRESLLVGVDDELC